MNILAKFKLQLYQIANRLYFLVFYPYLKPSKIRNIRNASLPRIFFAGKGLKLVISNPSKGHKNIIIEKGVWLGDDVELNSFGKAKIILKKGTSLQDRCKLIGNIVVNRNVIFAPNVYISSGTHQAFLRPHLTIREQDRLQNGEEFASRHTNVIEEDCWLGINAFIKAGVYIGRGSVIGANSTVSRDIPPYSVVVGNTKIIKSRLLFNPTGKINTLADECVPYLYRGFCFETLFWDEDNLTIFQNGHTSKVRVTFEKYSSVGSFEFKSNHGIKGVFKFGPGSTFSEAELSVSESLLVPQIISEFLCVKFMNLQGDRPKILSIEVS